MFRTQNLYQNDAKWANTKIGDSSETIGEWGGLLTSITMMLNGIGYNETPDTVNEKLLKDNAFLSALPIFPCLAYAWPNCIYRDMERCDGSDKAPIGYWSATTNAVAIDNARNTSTSSALRVLTAKEVRALKNV